ncbi:acetyltransferase [Pseudomonas sp. TCU-HL1]|uniref:acetyltransferase n=1 Tax=Pseudomonas sp. TCU-HL1 TaxID=1856685 RepID=UPI00083E63F2|nr:acetyltransferase [Pseudomonas sp. TCU-HL1]AOE84534.1 acetyltransferase [Pseudomonas sp. TCU-HL1]
MNRLALLGASGHGKVVADTAEACGWNSIVFFDDAWPASERNGPWPIDGSGADLLRRLSDFDAVMVSIGNNRIRLAKLESLRKAGARLINLIHPSAVISRYAVLGEGTVVFAGSVVNAFAQIGKGCILNTGCSVDHDCSLADAVHISPGARLAGGVRVGEGSWIGIGASVRQSVCIGSDVVVGAGAAVVADTVDKVTVVGVPARIK